MTSPPLAAETSEERVPAGEDSHSTAVGRPGSLQERGAKVPMSAVAKF